MLGEYDEDEEDEDEAQRTVRSRTELLQDSAQIEESNQKVDGTTLDSPAVERVMAAAELDQIPHVAEIGGSRQDVESENRGVQILSTQESAEADASFLHETADASSHEPVLEVAEEATPQTAKSEQLKVQRKEEKPDEVFSSEKMVKLHYPETSCELLAESEESQMVEIEKETVGDAHPMISESVHDIEEEGILHERQVMESETNLIDSSTERTLTEGSLSDDTQQGNDIRELETPDVVQVQEEFGKKSFQEIPELNEETVPRSGEAREIPQLKKQMKIGRFTVVVSGETSPSDSELLSAVSDKQVDSGELTNELQSQIQSAAERLLQKSHSSAVLPTLSTLAPIFITRLIHMYHFRFIFYLINLICKYYNLVLL